MPYFTNSEQLYKTMQLLFERLKIQQPSPIDALSTSRLIIRFTLSEPQAEITVNGRIYPPKILYGKSTLQPDLAVELAADTLHQILRDEVSLRGSLANRQLKVVGPIWKTNILADILSEGRNIYPQVLLDSSLL